MSIAREWEEVLTREGLGVIRPLTMSSNANAGHVDGLIVVPNPIGALSIEWVSGQTATSETPTAIYWRRFSSLVYDLPLGEQDRQFLLNYAEHGIALRACREASIERNRGMLLIKRTCAFMELYDDDD